MREGDRVARKVESPYPGHVVSGMTAEEQWSFRGKSPGTMGFSYGMSREKQLAWFDKHYRKGSAKGSRVARKVPRVSAEEQRARRFEAAAKDHAARFVDSPKAPVRVTPEMRREFAGRVAAAPVVAAPADIVVETSRGPVGFVRTGPPIVEQPSAEVVAERAAKGDVFVSSYRNRRGVERVSLNIGAELADRVLGILEREGLTITKGREVA